MGRAADLADLLLGAASRIRRLSGPQHRGKRAERLGEELAWLAADSRRLVLRDTGALVLSWPKSGRTWLRFMLDELGIHLEYSHRRETGTFPRAWKRKRILLLHRDPRDAALSHWFAATRRGGGYTGSLSDFLRDPQMGLDRSMRFNLGWKERLEREGNGLILSYEALHADTVGELGRAVAFLHGGEVGEEKLRAAVAAGRFENMRALEASGEGFRRYGDALMPGDPADPASFKIRAGRVGGWREHFGPSDFALADALLADRDYFRRMNG